MTINTFLLGAIAMAYLVASTFFLRFYRATKDRLFFMFGAAFGILAVNRTALAMIDHGGEVRAYLRVVRLVAFLCVLWAIVDKNRSTR